MLVSGKRRLAELHGHVQSDESKNLTGNRRRFALRELWQRLEFTMKHTTANTPSEPSASTQAFASLNAVQPQTVLKRLCQTGSYFGVVPVKLRNRRLLWPAVRVQ